MSSTEVCAPWDLLLPAGTKLKTCNGAETRSFQANLTKGMLVDAQKACNCYLVECNRISYSVQVSLIKIVSSELFYK